MRRRYLPALSDHRGRWGAYATEWEGWVNPRERSFEFSGKKNPTHAQNIGDIEDRAGCYAILYVPGSGTYYVAYIGSSKQLGVEIASKYRDWDLPLDASFKPTAIYIPNLAISREYESDLIRYYAPPWNIRFS